jgi:cation/acetate symporter
MNVSFLVGLAFAVAASANLPAILAVIFWKRTTYQGIAASIVTGILSSIVLILLSPTMFERYGLAKEAAIFPLDNPGIISLPLSLIMLVTVTLLTRKKESSI